MKKLIVNADDFGYSYSVNKGIIDAHINGIVTATSVMVDAIASAEAAGLSKYPNLSVGLHFVYNPEADVTEEIERQLKKFKEITGLLPDHINSHKIYTEDKRLMEWLVAAAEKYNIPLRRFNKALFIDSFFGPHADGDVSVTQLKRTIDHATEEYNEVMCHVGYSDDYLRETSSYNDIREEELATICAPEIKEYLKQNDINLINWKQI